MANNERLTKRVKKMEEWIAENEGGPTLNSFVYLVDALRNTSNNLQEVQKMFETQRSLLSEYFTDKDLLTDWNEWLADKEKNKNVVQDQKTEEEEPKEEEE
tara:strand:+ start:271 stop:573 length:303 start_codon:yes stop_codon:yes gene_type:complete